MEIIKCINCGADFKLATSGNAYSCPHCRTHYRINKNIIDTTGPDKKDDKRMTIDIKFEYRSKLWIFISGIIICLCCIVGSFYLGTLFPNDGIVFSIFMLIFFLLIIVPLFVGIYDNHKEYIKALHRKISYFHEIYFLQKNQKEEIKWEIVDE